MKVVARFYTVILIFTSFATLLLSCKKQVFKTDEPSFNLDRFEQNVRDRLDARCVVGYVYIISQNGQLARHDARGDAILSSTGATQPMTIDTRLSLASVSKFITALAITRAVYDNPNVQFTDPIGSYLPTSFTPTDDFKNITIHQLLTHTSGIKRNGQDGIPHQSFESLKTLASTFTLQDNNYQYCNKNYSLCRLILPNLLPGTPWVPGASSEEEAYALVFNTYIANNILKKANIHNPSLQWRDGYARLYTCQTRSEKSAGTHDWTLLAGAAGWYLSARELASLIAHVWFSDKILSQTERNFAFQNPQFYGLDDWITGEKHGNYLIKGGSYDSEVHAFFVHYPNGIQLVVLSSGMNLNTTEMLQLARDAFDDAWL